MLLQPWESLNPVSGECRGGGAGKKKSGTKAGLSIA